MPPFETPHSVYGLMTLSLEDALESTTGVALLSPDGVDALAFSIAELTTLVPRLDCSLEYGTSLTISTAGASANATARGFSIRSCTRVPGSTASSIFFRSCVIVKSASISSVSKEVS